jgi:anti-sigma-K factor RskA
VTDQRPDHARFDELAAGYALGALEPEDEWRFRAHASQCERCSQALADYTAVAAALAESAPDVRPSPALRARILAAAADRPQPATAAIQQIAGPPTGGPDSAAPAGTPQAPVVALTSRLRSRRLKVAAAAAAVIVAGAGTYGGLTAAGAGQSAPAAGCVAASQCTQVTLTAATGHQVVAGQVIVEGRSVWLRPARLPADDAARQIYVLWQLTGKRTPLAVGSFDVRAGAQAAIRIGTLAAPYRGTLAFAVSLEPGRTIPASPTQQVALGQVPPQDRS